jgi:hypothetical protein
MACDVISGHLPPPLLQARLVMRQRGNLRLLLNANLWADMQVTKMEGGKVRPQLACTPLLSRVLFWSSDGLWGF